MKFLIISGGKKTNYKIVKPYYIQADFTICVDKGLEYAEDYGIKPQMILGDMDSVSPKVLKKYHKDEINIFPRDKDYTDSEIAVRKAISLGAKDVTIICATGTRMDHTLSNIKLLILLKEKGITGRIIDSYNNMFLVDGYQSIPKKKDQIVSIIPLDTCYDVTAKGFLYPLTKEDLDINWNIGISNIIIESKGEISLTKGNLLVIITKNH